MKLSESQIQQIENYLDRKELFQLDVCVEVLDHIIMGIEKAMEAEKIDFELAFAIENEKWREDLSSFASWWVGWVWNGPKIVIKQCENWVKKSYLLGLMFSGLLGIPFYLLNYRIQELLANYINISISIFYYVIVLWGVWAYFRMKKNPVKTTYRFLFRVIGIGHLFMFVICNPIGFGNSFELPQAESFTPILLFYVFLVVIAFRFVGLYKMHHKFSKQVVV